MMAQHSKGHRRFAAFWDRMVRAEGPKERANRQVVVAAAHGRVLEIGVGVGANWEYLAPDADYTGIEPDPFMRARALKHAKERGLQIDLVDAGAEALPFADATFDAVFGTLVFCTVGDAAAGFAEIRRVLKPGGAYRFWEHVRPEGRFAGRVFDVLQPPWSKFGGGCHPNRRTVDAIRAAGFEVPELRRFRRAFVPEVVGVAISR